MVKMIISDTNILVAYYNENDYLHKEASKIMKEIFSGKFGELIISDYIFDELVTVCFRKMRELDKVVEIGKDVLSFTKLIHVNEDIFQDSWETFKNQKNTKFSFTDCSIIALMRNRNIKNLVTFDGDFLKVEGINIIN